MIHSSTTAAGQYIHSVRQRSHPEASYALDIFKGCRLNLSNEDFNRPEFLRGYTEAIIWKHGLLGFSDQIRDEIDKTRNNWRQFKEETNAQRSSWDSEFKQIQKSFEDKHNRWAADIEAKLLEIKAIKEPAAFWNRKRWFHYAGAVIWSLGIVAAVWVGGEWLWSVVEKIPTVAPDASYIAELPKLIPTLIGAVALLWLLRLLVRMLRGIRTSRPMLPSGFF